MLITECKGGFVVQIKRFRERNKPFLLKSGFEQIQAYTKLPLSSILRKI
jgi:hypothetical protein